MVRRIRSSRHIYVYNLRLICCGALLKLVHVPRHRMCLDNIEHSTMEKSKNLTRAENFFVCIIIEHNNRGTICMSSETYLPSGCTVYRYMPCRQS